MTETPTQTQTSTPLPLHRRIARWVLVITAVLVGAYLIDAWQASAGETEDQISWRTGDRAAFVEAREADKPVLLLYTASWCPPCKQLKAEVFADDDAAAWFEDNFIPVKLDTDHLNDQQTQQAQRLGITGIPTMIVMRPDGTVLTQQSGFHGKAAVLDWAQGAKHTYRATASR